MEKLFKGLGFGFLALALVVGVGAGSANAALTLSSVAVDSAAGDALTIGASNVGGTIAIGVANTGGITIGNGATIKTISIGAGNAVNTIKIGDNASPANVITIGGAASATTIKGTLTVGVDDTGHDVQLFGATASSNLLWDESADALELAGVARLDLSGATVLAANTDGGVIKAGTSAAPVTEDTANMKFMSFYFDNGATSGDNRGIYNKLDLTGAGGGGESLRSYTDLKAAAGTAHGAHISLGMGESTTAGSVTGLGVGVRATLGLPNAALPAGGTYAAMMPEIYSFGDDSDAGAVTELSFIRAVNGGNANGIADVDDDAVLLSLQGFTAGAGNMTVTDADGNIGNPAGTIRIKIGSTLYYLPYYAAAGTP
ncbi:MAG: hypothetical protein V1704_03440 [Candidatus Vogelbacteria bacterium]